MALHNQLGGIRKHGKILKVLVVFWLDVVGVKTFMSLRREIEGCPVPLTEKEQEEETKSGNV